MLNIYVGTKQTLAFSLEHFLQQGPSVSIGNGKKYSDVKAQETPCITTWWYQKTFFLPLLTWLFAYRKDHKTITNLFISSNICKYCWEFVIIEQHWQLLNIFHQVTTFHEVCDRLLFFCSGSYDISFLSEWKWEVLVHVCNWVLLSWLKIGLCHSSQCIGQ